jgi:hypothetical protein
LNAALDRPSVERQDVRAKDVASSRRRRHGRTFARSLISQGRIGAIISAKPQERRQMLRSGRISGLHVQHKDAEQKLRAAESNLARLATIRRLDARAGNCGGRPTGGTLPHLVKRYCRPAYFRVGGSQGCG